MSESTFIYPEIPAMVQLDATSMKITNLSTGWCCEATGVLADAARRVLDDQTEATPGVLAALGEQHDLNVALSLLGNQRRLPLTPTTALTLGQLETLFLELTGACNERCVHCYAEANPRVESALDRETCSAVIEDAAALGVRRVQLTGGEPLMCPFLVELAEEVHRRGMLCEVYTNGLLLDEPLLARLDPDRLQLAFSFYSHAPSVHDAITRRPGSQRSTAAAIRRAARGGFTVRVAIIVMQQNADDVSETMAFVRSLGVSMVTAGAAHAVGRGSYFSGDWTADDDRGSNRKTSKSLHEGKLCVASNGSVLPCIFNRGDVLGSIHERRLLDIVADPQLPHLPVAGQDPRLEDHRQQLQCLGCRLTALSLRQCARSRSAA